MPRPGLLTKDHLGFSMPAHAPLYPGPPYVYKDASLLRFGYVTDGASAAKMLPAELELADTATAGLIFASYPWSSLGAYLEVIQYLDATYQGRAVQFATHLYVTTDAAMAAGREMGGYPKKIGKIAFNYDVAYSASLERPTGTPICSGVLQPTIPLAAPTFSVPKTFDYMTLRIVPSPQAGVPPTVAELVETTWTLESGEAWTGPGSCLLTGASALDPLHLAPIVEPISCLFIRGTMVVRPNEDRKEYPL